MFKTLVVEDNSQFCFALRQILWQRFPFITLVDAADGAEALAHIDHWQPHLVFMDIRIPRGNGLELTRHVKRTQPETTIIIFTANDLPEYRQEAARCGADYFLAKTVASSMQIASVVECVLADRFKALIFAENEALRGKLSVSLSMKWPAMVVVEVREQEEAILAASVLKPDLLVLDLAQNDRGSESKIDMLQADRALCGAVVVSIRDTVDCTPCPTDYCVVRGEMVCDDIVSIVNSMRLGNRKH